MFLLCICGVLLRARARNTASPNSKINKQIRWLPRGREVQHGVNKATSQHECWLMAPNRRRLIVFLMRTCASKKARWRLERTKLRSWKRATHATYHRPMVTNMHRCPNTAPEGPLISSGAMPAANCLSCLTAVSHCRCCHREVLLCTARYRLRDADHGLACKEPSYASCTLI